MSGVLSIVCALAAAGLGAFALKEGNPVLPLAIAWALAAIGAEKATSAVGAKYTRASVKFTAYLLAGGLAALTLRGGALAAPCQRPRRRLLGRSPPRGAAISHSRWRE